MYKNNKDELLRDIECAYAARGQILRKFEPPMETTLAEAMERKCSFRQPADRLSGTMRGNAFRRQGTPPYRNVDEASKPYKTARSPPNKENFSSGEQPKKPKKRKD